MGVPEGEAVLRFVQVHAIHIRGVFQGQHIGTPLVHLQEIGPVLVEYREVGGDDDVFRPDHPLRRPGGVGPQFQDGAVLIDTQIFRHGRRKGERVELGLVWEPHRAHGRKGQGRPFRQFRRKPQGLQGAYLLLQLFPVVQGVDVGVLFLEAAVDVPAQCPVLFQRRLVSRQIQPCLLRAEPPDQLVVEEPVLGGDFGGGALGCAAADMIRLYQQDLCPCLGQFPGAEQACQPAADYQNVCPHFTPQAGKAGHGALLCPKCFHPVTNLLKRLPPFCRCGNEAVSCSPCV